MTIGIQYNIFNIKLETTAWLPRLTDEPRIGQIHTLVVERVENYPRKCHGTKSKERVGRKNACNGRRRYTRQKLLKKCIILNALNKN